MAEKPSTSEDPVEEEDQSRLLEALQAASSDAARDMQENALDLGALMMQAVAEQQQRSIIAQEMLTSQVERILQAGSDAYSERSERSAKPLKVLGDALSAVSHPPETGETK